MGGFSSSLRRKSGRRQQWPPAVLEQKATHERLQQLTAAEMQKAMAQAPTYSEAKATHERLQQPTAAETQKATALIPGYSGAKGDA